MRASVWVVLAIGCGPQVDPPGTGDDDTTASPTSTGSPTTMPSTTASTSAAQESTGIADTGTASDTTPSDGGYEEDSGGTGCAFTCPPPPTTGGGGGECDLVGQDCPDGEKCMPWANDGGEVWNTSRCSPLDPAAAGPGEPCTVEGSGASGIDNCSMGAMCFDVDPKTNTGICRGFCLPPVEPCPAEQACFRYVPGLVELCVDGCDPLEPLACGARDRCAPQSDGFSCTPGIGEAIGAPCLALDACATGSVCVAGNLLPDCDGPGCCAAACDLAAPSCDDGLTCTPWRADPPAQWADVGVCLDDG